MLRCPIRSDDRILRYPIRFDNRILLISLKFLWSIKEEADISRIQSPDWILILASSSDLILMLHCPIRSDDRILSNPI